MRKVKVRIAVAVDPRGSWYASGWNVEECIDEDEAMSIASEGVAEGDAQYWVEAELDVPDDPVVVQGVVTKA